MNPMIGSQVHFVLENEQHRPAVVVKVHSNNLVNLQVFFDAGNDDVKEKAQPWRSNVAQGTPSKEANFYPKGTWHWPEPQ